MSVSIDDVKKWTLGLDESESIASNINKLQIEIGFSIWLDQFGEKIIREFKFSPNGAQDFLVYALYLRMHNSHKAVVREAIFGFWTESECIARPLFEALILLYEAVKNADFAHQYSLSQNRLIEDMTNKYARDQKRTIPQLIQISKLDTAKILDKIKTEGKGDWSLEQLADKNGLTLLHDQIYKMYHNSVHVKPNSLDRHFNVEGDEIKNLVARPEIEYPKEMINTVLLTYADGIKKFTSFFKLGDLEKEINEKWLQLHAHSLKTGKS